MEIHNVFGSEYMAELKTGSWKKQLNEMTNGTYQVEVYWVPWLSESERIEEWEKSFANLKEAEQFYESLKKIAQARKSMTRR